jgi:hypothetical protein
MPLVWLQRVLTDTMRELGRAAPTGRGLTPPCSRLGCIAGLPASRLASGPGVGLSRGTHGDGSPGGTTQHPGAPRGAGATRLAGIQASRVLSLPG